MMRNDRPAEEHPVSRRAILAATLRTLGAAFLATAAGGIAGAGAAGGPGRWRGPHPDPRPGIDASHILAPEKVREHPGAVAAFDEARAIPDILDGIRCQCGCADQPGMRSLLSCYEGDGMALDCPICQGQARLAFRMHRQGRSLDRIRSSIDARYGS